MEIQHLLDAVIQLPLSGYIYPLVVIFFAYIIRGIAGFGSALIAVPLLALILPLTIVVPLVVMLDYLASATQGIGDRSLVNWKNIWPLLPFSLVGVLCSLFLLNTLDKKILSILLGAFIILFAIYQLLPIKWGTAKIWSAAPFGFLGGMVGTLFGTGGPFYVIYLSLRKLDKSEFRATFASIFLIDGAFRLIGFAANGSFDQETQGYLLLLLPFAASGLFIGGKIHTDISRDLFVKVISLLLLASGSLLINRYIFSYPILLSL
jgi:uncharacterized protein